MLFIFPMSPAPQAWPTSTIPPLMRPIRRDQKKEDRKEHRGDSQRRTAEQLPEIDHCDGAGDQLEHGGGRLRYDEPRHRTPQRLFVAPDARVRRLLPPNRRDRDAGRFFRMLGCMTEALRGHWRLHRHDASASAPRRPLF
jgi:hypothetical protein